VYQLTPSDFADDNAADIINKLANMGESNHLYYSNCKLYLARPCCWLLTDVTHLVEDTFYSDDTKESVCNKVANSIDAILKFTDVEEV
jgi:hypothetical protein